MQCETKLAYLVIKSENRKSLKKKVKIGNKTFLLLIISENMKLKENVSFNFFRGLVEVARS